MIAENTIEITNATELSIAYLTRFFSKAGTISKISKNQQKQIVYIEFNNQQSVDKAFQFNGRVLDKKPISIKKQPLILETIKQKPLQNKRKKVEQKLIKLPCLHDFKHSSYKIPVRSEYRLIQQQDSLSNSIVSLRDNPLENIRSKSQLWMIIFHQIQKHASIQNQANKELILSVSLCIWALIQLKLSQIRHLISCKQNQKSKYIENFIQEIAVNKLNLLQNDKLINSANKFKTLSSQNLLQFSFTVPYPEQIQQEAKFYSQANEVGYKFLCVLYHHSHLLGKMFHELQTNSMIIFQNQQTLQLLIDKFYSKQSSSLIKQSERQSIKYDQIQEIYDQQSLENKCEKMMSFSGQIQNYGSYIFQGLMPFEIKNHSNSIIWMEINNEQNVLSGSYPNFLNCNYIFNGCKSKTLQDSNFYHLYEVDPSTNSLKKKESHSTQDFVIVFEDGQFSLNDIIQNSLSLIKYQLTNILAQKSAKSNAEQAVDHHRDTNSLHTEILIHTQQQFDNPSTIQIENEKPFEQKQIVDFGLDIFYVGILIKQNELLISESLKKLMNLTEKLQQKFINRYKCFRFEIKVNLLSVEMIPSKQNEFNAFKCENFLINHIDCQIIAKNSIIASEEFAEKVAEKVLQESSGKELFGFKDKKYIGSEIWRLYNKSGVRRAKMKISQFHFKKLKSE